MPPIVMPLKSTIVLLSLIHIFYFCGNELNDGVINLPTGSPSDYDYFNVGTN